MDRIYLISDNGDTGESFRDWTEMHQWYGETVGNYPSTRLKASMRRGDEFKVGSRYYRCEKRQVPELAAA